MNNMKFRQHLNKDKEELNVEYQNLKNLPKPTFLKRTDKQAKKKSPKIKRI